MSKVYVVSIGGYTGPSDVVGVYDDEFVAADEARRVMGQVESFDLNVPVAHKLRFNFNFKPSGEEEVTQDNLDFLNPLTQYGSPDQPGFLVEVHADTYEDARRQAIEQMDQWKQNHQSPVTDSKP